MLQQDGSAWAGPYQASSFDLLTEAAARRPRAERPACCAEPLSFAGVLGQIRSSTALCFAPVASGEARTYRCGDAGRFTAEGLLFIEAHDDTRVKIHGYRIELSEVEAAILRQPGVTQAVVAVRAQANDHPQLVAYFSCEPGSELRERRYSCAPINAAGYMVPAAIVLLDDFHSLPTGRSTERSWRMAPAPAAPALESSPVDGDRATGGPDLVGCSRT